MDVQTTASPDSALTRQAGLLLDGLRALFRTQQISERTNAACCDMTMAQAATLHVLYLEGGMRFGALGRRLGITPSTLTRNVERIEARGWIERRPDPADGRAFRIDLTEPGRRRARQIEDQNQQFARLLLTELGPERGNGVVDGLFHLLEAIDRLAGPAADEPAVGDQFRPIHEFLKNRQSGQSKEET